MTQEKALLLKDFCARLPYEVIVNIEYSKEHGSSYRLRVCSEGILKLNTELLGLFIQDEIYLKPYLRPMSNMTEEEKKEFSVLAVGTHLFKGPLIPSYDTLDWLNSHHFDYRGLIPMGLALEAPEEMYNLENLI